MTYIFLAIDKSTRRISPSTFINQIPFTAEYEKYVEFAVDQPFSHFTSPEILSYSSSDTGSYHSVRPFSEGTSIARC